MMDITEQKGNNEAEFSALQRKVQESHECCATSVWGGIGFCECFYLYHNYFLCQKCILIYLHIHLSLLKNGSLLTKLAPSCFSFCRHESIHLSFLKGFYVPR